MMLAMRVHAQRLPLLLLLPVLLLVSATLPSTGRCTSTVDALREEISQESSRAKEHKKTVSRLSGKERDLYKNLAVIEDRSAKLEKAVWKEETQLAKIEKAQDKLVAEHARLAEKRKKLTAELDEILARLWPLHLQRSSGTLSLMSSWKNADRRFTWMRHLYDEAGVVLADIQRQSTKLAANLAKQDTLRRDAVTRLESVNKKKDALLQDKLALVKSIRTIRAQRLSEEEALSDVLSAVKSLKYKLKALTTRNFADFRGNLPWPVHGKIVARYAPRAKPPVRGLGLRVAPDAPIQAMSWGKVVHNDTLRGFGKVIIVFHGKDYYTLYAFLEQSNVRVGQDVEKGETIGYAGYYPKAKGPGLYFELRFHKKALNPNKWLASLKN